MEHLLPFMINHWGLCIALVAVLVLILMIEQGVQLGGAAAISPPTAVNLMNHDHAVVIDIRNTDTYRSGHIIDAHNLTIEEINNKPQKIDKFKHKHLIIVCANGQESAKIAATLKKKGFDQVVSLKGGIAAWEITELPLTK